jgi:carboxypeptidase PM20D1
MVVPMRKSISYTSALSASNTKNKKHSGLHGINTALPAKHLSEAIQFRTISYNDTSEFDVKEFYAFHKFLRKTYPALHRTLKCETINLSLLYTWKGTDTAAKAIMLLGHIDVVPIESEIENNWTHPPFAGTIDGGYVWGRGAIDIKCTVIGLMEAVENLIKVGFKPRRTVCIAIGHDQEVGGLNGATAISNVLKQRGRRLALPFPFICPG